VESSFTEHCINVIQFNALEITGMMREMYLKIAESWTYVVSNPLRTNRRLNKDPMKGSSASSYTLKSRHLRTCVRWWKCRSTTNMIPLGNFFHSHNITNFRHHHHHHHHHQKMIKLTTSSQSPPRVTSVRKSRVPLLIPLVHKRARSPPRSNEQRLSPDSIKRQLFCLSR
jgi:hypothetical protein